MCPAVVLQMHKHGVIMNTVRSVNTDCATNKGKDHTLSTYNSWCAYFSVLFSSLFVSLLQFSVGAYKLVQMVTFQKMTNHEEARLSMKILNHNANKVLVERFCTSDAWFAPVICALQQDNVHKGPSCKGTQCDKKSFVALDEVIGLQWDVTC